MAITKEISIQELASQSVDAETELKGETMSLNIGPSHPTTHGVLRLLTELDGDVITKCAPVIGYLHRGSEKIAENMTFNQHITMSDHDFRSDQTHFSHDRCPKCILYFCNGGN